MEKRKMTAGFTLVELIVVIAILGILAGVGTVGYSGYIKKANMAADQQLASGVKNALELAYYADPVGYKTGRIELTTSGINTNSNAFVESALDKAYGADVWKDMALKYDGWVAEQSSYGSSSFYGKETELLGDVDALTDVLASVIAGDKAIVGNNFSEYLSDIGITDDDDEDKIADAAVLYVAQSTANITPTQEAEFINYMSNLTNTSPTVDQISAELLKIFDGSAVTASAALYAFAEGYCQYEATVDGGNPDLLETLRTETNKISTSDITSTNKNAAIKEIYTVFGKIQSEAVSSATFANYFSEGYAAKDAAAYLDVMTTVSSAQSELVSSLGEDFATNTDIQNLFSTYADGGIFVIAKSKGEIVITPEILDG